MVVGSCRLQAHSTTMHVWEGEARGEEAHRTANSRAWTLAPRRHAMGCGGSCNLRARRAKLRITVLRTFKVDSKKTIKKNPRKTLERSERSNPQAGGRRHTGSGAGEGHRWRQCQSHTPPSPPRRARRNNSAASSRRTRCAHRRRTDSLATAQRRGALPCSAAERKRPRERVDAASRRNLQPQLRRGGAASRRWSALGDSAR